MSLLGYIVAIAAIDSLNPTATALQIYLLTTPKPVGRSIALISGIFVAYWTVGLLATVGLTRLIQWVFLTYSEWISLIQCILGIALLYVGWTLNSSSNAHQTLKNKPNSLQPIHTFFLGMSVTLLEAPTALPYIAAIERIAQAKLSFYDLAGVLSIYNVVFVMPLIGLLGIYISFQDRRTELLKQINQSITQWTPKIMRVLLLVTGSVLLVSGIMSILVQSRIL
jgi:cytochrome c biogenesis protein CcdA